MSCENLFGDTIYSYSRAQAIADGILIDLSQVETIRQHWKHPFACTAAAYDLIEEGIERGEHDLTGICHDLSELAQHTARANAPTDLITFDATISGRVHKLKLHIGPGDTAAPVLTLMLPYED